MNRRSLKLSIHGALAGALLSTVAVTAPAQQQDECVDLQGTPPGLYVTVDQSQVYLIKDGKVVELDPGEAAYANETDLACLRVPPRVLAWPCDTAEAMTRKMAPTYSRDQLPAVGSAKEVARRYFEENQAIGPPIEWLNGDTHGDFPAEELEELDTSAYWYLPGPEGPLASSKRPRAQLIGLFWATGQVVLDRNTLTALEIEHADGQIPTVFFFNRDNEVPVSFFGPNPTLKQVTDAFFERGIELAPVPVWYAGDHHLEISVTELEELFDIPALDEIPAERQAAIRAELEAHGFLVKPLAVSIIEEAGNMVLDQPDRVRVAASMGMGSLPLVLFYFNSASHLAGCGVELPQVSVVGGMGGGGEAPDINIPPQLPDPERKPSDS